MCQWTIGQCANLFSQNGCKRGIGWKDTLAHGMVSTHIVFPMTLIQVRSSCGIGWFENYLISETTCFQGRSLLSCAETPSVKHAPSRHVCRYGEGNSEGGFTPQRYEKFFNWQWILGNGQWKFDNRQLFFWQVILKPLKCNYLHRRAKLYIPGFAYRCMMYSL